MTPHLLTQGVNGVLAESPQLWQAGVERWARLIFCIWASVALLSGPNIAVLANAPEEPLIAAWSAGAFTCAMFVLVRLLMGRVSALDPAVALSAMVMALWSNRLLGADGAGADAGPALPFALALLVGCATFASTRVAIALALGTSSLYVLLREWWAGPGLFMSSIDEMVVLGGTGASIHALMFVLRSAAVEADRLHAFDMEAERSRAEQEARRQSIDDIRHVLHDEVVAALVLLDLPTPLPHQLSMAAAKTAVEQFEQLDSWHDPEPRTYHLAPEAGVDVKIDVEEPFQFDMVPGAVQSAFAGAVGEAVRNVRRHSGTNRARVLARNTPDGGVEITVEDDGRGMDTTRAVGFGITVSILARMRGVGGRADITSDPGGGTQVRLTWSQPDSSSPPRADPWFAAWGSIMTTVPHMRSGLAPIVFTYAASQSWAAGRNMASGRSLIGSIGAAAALLAITWAITRRASRAPLNRAILVSLTFSILTILALGLWNAGPSALTGFGSWVQGMTVAPLIVVAMLAPARWAISAAALNSAVVLGAAVLDPTITPLEALSPIVGSIITTSAFLAAAAAFRRISAQVSMAEREISASIVNEVRSTARAKLLSQDLAHLDESVMPFLRGIASGELAADDPSVRERARTLSTQVRDDLLVPTVVDGDLRRVLASIRADGGTVTFRVDDLPPDDPVLITRLLKLILDRVDQRVVVIISDAGAEVTASISPPIVHERVARIRSVLRDHVTVEVPGGDRTRLSIDCIALAASPELLGFAG